MRTNVSAGAPGHECSIDFGLRSALWKALEASHRRAAAHDTERGREQDDEHDRSWRAPTPTPRAGVAVVLKAAVWPKPCDSSTCSEQAPSSSDTPSGARPTSSRARAPRPAARRIDRLRCVRPTRWSTSGPSDLCNAHLALLALLFENCPSGGHENQGPRRQLHTRGITVDGGAGARRNGGQRVRCRAREPDLRRRARLRQQVASHYFSTRAAELRRSGWRMCRSGGPHSGRASLIRTPLLHSPAWLRTHSA